MIFLKEYQLKEYDIIKLGRVKFRVKELKANKNVVMKQNDSQIDDIYELVNFIEILSKILSGQITVVVLKKIYLNNTLLKKCKQSFLFIWRLYRFENQELSCRVCLSSENSEENPLISPCACAGSVKHIHLDCLKEWIKSKRNIRSDGLYVSYSWETLKCELCHHTLPGFISLI